MVKEPVAGRVKTRLARGIGVVAATSAYRTMQSSLVARLSHAPHWHTVIAVTPDTALAGAMLPPNTDRIAQGHGDLGQRLQHVFDVMPPGPVVVIGTDIPAIRPADIANAFRALGSHDAVIGPARDGGYWLIGMKRQPRVLHAFENVRWSSEHALADTVANLEGHTLARLGFHDDVDTEGDLAALRPFIGRSILPRKD